MGIKGYYITHYSNVIVIDAAQKTNE